MRDSEQDEKIEENAEKISEHEQALSEQQKKDAEHDEKFAENDLRDSKQDERINEHDQALSEQQKKDVEHDKKFAENDLRDSAQDEKISALKDDLAAYKFQVQNQIEKIYSKTTDDKDEINKLIEDYEVNNKKKIEELTRRIELIESVIKKKGWKIAVSVGAGISFILNLLQIFEVL